MKTVTIFSIDYDGHGSILASDEVNFGPVSPTSGEHKYAVDEGGLPIGGFAPHANYYPLFKQAINGARQTLDEYFKHEALGSELIEGVVGSNRQSQEINEQNANSNKNGCCFKNLHSYCKNNGWGFNMLLAADTANGLKPGTAMKRALGIERGKQVGCPFDPRKTSFIIEQLKDAARRYPHKKIKFIFSDDDANGTILPALERAIKSEYKDPKTQKLMPQNLVLKLVKFDWFPIIQSVTLPDASHSLTNTSVQYFKNESKKLIKQLILKFNVKQLNESDILMDNKSETKKLTKFPKVPPSLFLGLEKDYFTFFPNKKRFKPDVSLDAKMCESSASNGNSEAAAPSAERSSSMKMFESKNTLVKGLSQQIKENGEELIEPRTMPTES